MAKGLMRLAAGLILVGLVGSGCSRVVKEGLYAVTGSSGKAVLLQGNNAQVHRLALEYGGVVVEPFSNDVGDAAPQAFVDALSGAITKRLQYRDRSMGERFKGVDKEAVGPFFRGPAHKVLLIRGRVIQYDKSGTADKALGPMDEAICRIQFLDQATNTLLAEANCTGRSKSSVRTGPKELADGVAKAVRNLLKPKKDKK